MAALVLFLILCVIVVALGIALAPHIVSILLWGVALVIVLGMAGWALDLLLAIPDGLAWCWKRLRRGFKRT